MILINGKKFDPAKAIVLYSDGMFSDNSVTYWMTGNGTIVRCYSSIRQYENDVYRILTKEDFRADMENSPHPKRAYKALQSAGIDMIEL